jgi:RNA polymerase sigma-70 factor, ECF subfamily
MVHTVMPGSPARPSDGHEALLLRRVAAQDRHALAELYNAYHRRLSRFLLRLAPRHQFAEEVINDTFWVVWQKAGEFRGASRVSTWIMGIAYRRALRALRDARVIDAGRQFQDEASGASFDEEAREMQDWIARGLIELPDEQRLALELAYFMGHSCEEIAEITGCAVGTVKARMFHAREKLRRSLPTLGGGEAGGAS